MSTRKASQKAPAPKSVAKKASPVDPKSVRKPLPRGKPIKPETVAAGGKCPNCGFLTVRGSFCPFDGRKLVPKSTGEHFAELGRAGGQKLLKKRGKAYYSEIAKKSHPRKAAPPKS